MRGEPIDRTVLESLVRASLETGDSSECGNCEVLKGRSADRGMLMRLFGADGESVIAKAWRARNRKERLKSHLGLSMARREWRAHRHLERAGVSVPRLLDFLRVRCSDRSRFDVVVVEDLGVVTPGVRYLKQLIQAGDEAGVSDFEHEVTRVSKQLVDLRVIDVDNQLNNFVTNSQRRVIRIDFECARLRRRGACASSKYVTMLDRLFRSHLHATHPDSSRSVRFLKRVLNELGANSQVRSRFVELSRRALIEEHEKRGLEYHVDWRLLNGVE